MLFVKFNIFYAYLHHNIFPFDSGSSYWTIKLKIMNLNLKWKSRIYNQEIKNRSNNHKSNYLYYIVLSKLLLKNNLKRSKIFYQKTTINLCWDAKWFCPNTLSKIRLFLWTRKWRLKKKRIQKSKLN